MFIAGWIDLWDDTLGERRWSAEALTESKEREREGERERERRGGEKER